LIGFVVFGVLIFLAFRISLKHFRHTQNGFSRVIALAVFAAICGVLVHGTVDYLFHTTPQATALFFLVLGLLSAQALAGETVQNKQAA
ncbi:MAG: hypothetical protein WA672_10410, partial [Candidatus Angelobacter sp.]